LEEFFKAEIDSTCRSR